ncbi:hypothetical protein [Amycolatopsis sp. CA-230715]|uniref:hypothetical protein n=1 Tax=Amycolatopsis sp. CA-230715 TaxID=2745196 RepID=UPI001C012896|nr:hypothetical protein [Amycolatopsis sp. CA-230715]QWF84279.1 hypothetical protein HUW46_07729 [Amycolatopsis sp. CA-230715]
MNRQDRTTSRLGSPGPFLAAPVSTGNTTATRAVTISVQVVVAIAAIAVRFAAPGWLLLFFLMGGCLVGLVPLIIATAVGVRMLRQGTRTLRTATVAMLAVMDLALLTFALTLPDITDQADTNFVPAVRLFEKQSAVSQHTAAVYGTIAEYAAYCYLIAAAGTAGMAVVAAIARRIRASRTTAD